MDDSHRAYVEQKRLDINEYTLYDFIYVTETQKVRGGSYRALVEGCAVTSCYLPAVSRVSASFYDDFY